MRRQSVLLSTAFFAAIAQFGAAQEAPLPAPGFHHLHLNSPDPEAEIAFYVKNFTTTQKGDVLTWMRPAPGKRLNVWLLRPQSAFKGRPSLTPAERHLAPRLERARTRCLPQRLSTGDLAPMVLPLGTGEGDLTP